MSNKTEFDYLLNAMELAGHAERPFAAGYGDKRAALLDHVRALEKDAERYRKLCEVPQAIDAFTAAYYNTQTKEQIDEAIDKVPAVGAA